MCKIMVMSGINRGNAKNAWKLVEQMAKEMSTGSEKDGLGYAAIHEDGSLFGERWLKNDQAFKQRNPLSEIDERLLRKYNGMIYKPKIYDSFGSMKEEPGFDRNGMCSITLHTRHATTPKAFYNTHPFVSGFTSLIHNGVIQNINKGDLKMSSCDSEKILQMYLKHGVNEDMSNVQLMANELVGYYACGVLSRDVEGNPILDVFKDTSAQLTAGYVRELGTLVFVTAMGQLAEACKTLNFNIDSVYIVAPGMLLRYNAITGEVIDTVHFDPDNKVTGNSVTVTATKGSSSEDEVESEIAKRLLESASCDTTSGIRNGCLPGNEWSKKGKNKWEKNKTRT